MSRCTDILLTTKVEAIPSIGPRLAPLFHHLGMDSVADLVLHVPARYEYDHAEGDIEQVTETAETGSSSGNVSIRGEVTRARFIARPRARLDITLEDDSGSMKVSWFNTPWMRDRIHPGMRLLVTGRCRKHRGTVSITNPQWHLISEDTPTPKVEGRYRPVYGASEELSSRQIESAIDSVLEPALAALEDHLPAAYREKRSLPSLADAYRLVHRPGTEDDVEEARRRLILDEFLLLQLAVKMKQNQRAAEHMAPILHFDEEIERRILGRFPFQLTASQHHVIRDITHDLGRDVPMNRLLQGDVGSGKTVVALHAMLTAVASGYQAVMMAPTELLAEQHCKTIRDMLHGSDVRIELLTGSLAQGTRDDIHGRIEGGESNLVIGTHALLTGSVTFHRLAVAVIDEQHRFGVHQRCALRGKGQDRMMLPHTLVMTATPIPRTLAMTVYGDLDCSIINELPPGRQPILTTALTRAEASTAYHHAREAIAAGEQVFIVVPVIEESEIGLKDVHTHLQWLQQGFLAGHQLMAVHGRLRPTEREDIMRRFRDGDLDAIVATTVIEVGVDIPGATVMIIEHADRFGLAQIHQLRGRVGRGSAPSRCFLVADATTEDATLRIAAAVDTADGFRIAELDLEIRGPGEFFGDRQSGIPPFQLARIPHDVELLALARSDAGRWIEEDATLEGTPLLKRRLLKRYGRALELGDIA